MPYDEDNISILENMEAVRKRPSMYIGALVLAFRHMFSEIIANSIDEVMAGYCNEIHVIFDNGVVSVEDNGRGIPYKPHPKTGQSTIEVVMTILHAGGKFDDKTYKTSGGLHGVGASVVNALSDDLTVDVYRDNKHFSMRFNKGKKITDLIDHGDTDKRGTKVTFKPDFTILPEQTITLDEFREQLHECACLNKGLKIHFTYNQEKFEFFSDKGILELLNLKFKNFIHNPIVFEKNELKVAFGWGDNGQENFIAFTNNIRQKNGGTHCAGFINGITKSLRKYIDANYNEKERDLIKSEDIKSDLYFVIAYYAFEPEFNSQDKTTLTSSSARKVVEEIISNIFGDFLEYNPKISQIIIKKIIESAKERNAIEQAKENFKKIGEPDMALKLNGKLIDCDRTDIENTELFIVEGDSAGGSVVDARNQKNQAMLALRGKILNTFKASHKQSLESDPITDLLYSIGTGIDENFDITKLRYGKIIILTDADVDGFHIATLILACVIKFMPKLIEKGHVYIARPPLYKLTIGKDSMYIKNDKQLKDVIFDRLINTNTIYDKNNQQMNKFEVLELFDLCEKFVFNLEKFFLISNKELLSLALTYNILEDESIFIKNAKEVIDGEVIIKEKNTNEVVISVKNRYSDSITRIPNSSFGCGINKFPIKLNNKIYYEPIEFFKVFNNLLYHRIVLQRFKGLGEMNPNQLFETTLDPKVRTLLRVTLKQEIIDHHESDFDEIFRLMGESIDENRRDYILQNVYFSDTKIDL